MKKITNCPWPEDIFSPISKKEREKIVDAMTDHSGVRSPSDRFCASERRAGWSVAMDYTKPTLEKIRAWLKREASKEPCPDFEKDCINCQMWELIFEIDSIPFL